MPRKTLALISGLVLVTVVLFVIALKTNNPQHTAPGVTPSEAPVVNAEPTAVPAHAVLSIQPNPLTVSPGQQGSAEVTLDAMEHPVTAVQLELKYDPAVISNVKVMPGSLFPNPVILIDKNDAKAGTYTYAVGIGPNQPTLQGTGTVGKVTFTVKRGAAASTQLELTPSSIVTARGVATSVLGNAAGTTIMIGGAAGQTTQPANGTSGGL